MNSARYILSIALLTSTFLVCMDVGKTAQQFFTLIPKEEPNQPCIIPLEHAQQCQPIVDLFKDLSSNETPISLPDWPIENVSGRDILNFVFYLEDIYNINQLSKDDVRQQPFHTRIVKQINSLTTPQLINLFTIVDVTEVIDRNNHHWMVDAIASRFLTNLNQTDTFNCLQGKPLFRLVVPKINNPINFEKNYIEPYGKTLTQRQELDRTVSVFTAMWYNVSNALTAPIRWFSSPSWATKTIMKPYYLDNKTGTMITGFVQKIDQKDKIVSLFITKKNNQKITISLADKNITTIKQIEANKDESVFICRTDKEAIVINTLNKENPIVDYKFRDCVFSDVNNQLYFITSRICGIWNLEDSSRYGLIEELAENKIYATIKINKKGTNFILHYHTRREMDHDRDEIDSNEDEYIDEVWRFKKYTHDGSFSKKMVFEAPSIRHICLHPIEDMFCVQYYDIKNILHTASINIDTKEITPLDRIIPSANIFQFIADSDILFIGTSAPRKIATLFYSSWQDDYFVNTKNGHVWSKQKNKSNEMRILGTKETEAAECYERIALTANGMQVMEQRAEGNPLMQFCSRILTPDEESTDVWSINKIAAASLIDPTILQTINKINLGLLAPEEIALMSQRVKDQSYQKEKEAKQSIVKTIGTIVGLGAALIGHALKIEQENDKNRSKEYTKMTNENNHGYTIQKIVMPFILGTFLLFFLNQIAAQY